MTKSVRYYQGEYYGPFDTGYRAINRMVYVNTKISEHNYLLDKYTIIDNTIDPVLYCEYYKSEKGNEELLEAKNAIEILGGSVDKQISYQLPDSDLSRNLILIRKRNITPKKYPRKAGIPSKEPL